MIPILQFAAFLNRSGLVILVLALCGCARENAPVTYHLRKNIVYEIKDTGGPKEPEIVLPADTSYLEHVFRNYDLVDVRSLDSAIGVDLRYAGTNNFLKKNFYDGLRNAYMTCDLALRVCNARYFLKQLDSTLTLVILDAARPRHLQQMMWDSLDIDPDRKFNYLSPPEATSLHNYGCAVDVTLADAATGTQLDMGTAFDHFGKLSQPVHEAEFLKSGDLSPEAIYNRKLLRYVMKAAGLRTINSEWWHFSLCTKPEAAARYELIR